MRGVISNIQRFSIHDGPGIRLTVFFQGCPLDCWWCHNPENIPYGSIEDCDLKTVYTPEQLMTEIRKELVFIDESGGGVTFSGGEPFMQGKFLAQVLSLCKAEEIHTTVDTSGYVNEDLLNSMIQNIDLFLYDIKIVDADLHKKYTGIKNEVIINNLQRIVEGSKKVIIRFPLIPEITDTEQNIRDVIALMKSLQLKDINILPYHRIAEKKYDKYGCFNRMKGIKQHTQEEVEKYELCFKNAGLNAKIGG